VDQDTKVVKPQAPPFPTHEQVPPELLPLKRWVGWRYELNNDRTKWVKLPLSSFNGKGIGVTPRGTEGQDWECQWADFDTALTGAKRLKLDGVGFVFVEGEGFTGVDFDDCRFSESGIIRDVPRQWLDNFDTYVEVSPSGTGVHAIGKATLQAPGNKQPMPDDLIVKAEMYHKARYFTFTGQRLDGKPLEIRHVQREFNALHHHVFGDASLEPSEPGFPSAQREFFTDERIISRISASKKWSDIFNPEKKAQVQEFVAQHYKGDNSSADLAFCTLVARNTMSAAQVERLWKRCILWRDKAARRADYRRSTINLAISETHKRLPLVNTANLAEVTWLWPGRFPRGKLVLLDGDPGLSKSMFSLAVAVSVMTGRPLLDGAKPEATGGVVLLSAEDDLRDTINPRLVAAGAPPSQQVPMIHVPSTKADGGQFSLASADDRFELEVMISRVDAKLVIIDPLNAYLGDKVDSHNDQKIRQVLGPLSEIANRTGAVVLCLRHLAKSGGSKAMYRGMGSIGYTAAARANFFVAEHPEEKETFVIAASKFNLGPKPPSLKYKLALAKVQGISKPVPYVAGGEPCDLTANDLAASQSKETENGDGKLSQAKFFIQKMLDEGPVPSKKMENDAHREGISPMTLRRARDEMKVETYPDTDAKGKKQYWWRLTQKMELPF